MSLAQWSNMFVYASMAMYAMAMVAFAASFASARAGSVARCARPRARMLPDVDVEPLAVGAVQRDSAAQARAAARAEAGSRDGWLGWPRRRARPPRPTRPCPPAAARATSGCR